MTALIMARMPMTIAQSANVMCGVLLPCSATKHHTKGKIHAMLKAKL
jgi:hypothetical protein